MIKSSAAFLVIERYGWFDRAAIVIEDEMNGTLYLLDGRHRFAAAKRIGLRKIPVIIVEFSKLPEFHLYYNSMKDSRIESAGNRTSFTVKV